MNPWAFERLNEVASETFYEEAEYCVWHGMRTLAMGSMLYDVLNPITIDSKLAPYSSSEHDLLLQPLDKVKAGDMLLLARGYPCFWLLFLLKAKGPEFCVRLKEDWWFKVKELTESDEKERIVSFSLPKKTVRNSQVSRT